MGVERPLSPSLFTSCQLAKKCKVEARGHRAKCGREQRGSRAVTQIRLTMWSWPVPVDASDLRASLSEIIDEKMYHFLEDTPFLMICQIVHTADLMFCETPDTSATEYKITSSGIHIVLS